MAQERYNSKTFQNDYFHQPTPPDNIEEREKEEEENYQKPQKNMLPWKEKAYRV